MSSPTPYSSRPRGALGGNPSATSCCPEQPSLMWAAHPKPGIVWERFPTRTGAGGSPVFPVGRLALGHIQYGPGVSLAEESTKLQATAREQKLFSSFIKKKKKSSVLFSASALRTLWFNNKGDISRPGELFQPVFTFIFQLFSEINERPRASCPFEVCHLHAGAETGCL